MREYGFARIAVTMVLMFLVYLQYELALSMFFFQFYNDFCYPKGGSQQVINQSCKSYEGNK